MRRLAAAGVSCLLVLSLAAPAVAAPPDLVDCRSNPDALAPAIAAASPGATIVIRGTCVGNFVVDKDLVLEGVGGNPGLDGQGSGTVLLIMYPGFDVPAVNVTVDVSRLAITGGDTGIAAHEFTTVSLA